MTTETKVEAVAWAIVADGYMVDYADTTKQRCENVAREYGEGANIAIEPLYPASAITALEGEVAELREELERSRRDYELLANESIYDGNSIGWIASKAKNYGDALLKAWEAVGDVGGTCDGNTPLHEAIRKQLTKVTP